MAETVFELSDAHYEANKKSYDPIPPTIGREQTISSRTGREESPELHSFHSRTKKYPTVLDQFGNRKKIRHYCTVPSCIITEHSRKSNREKYNFFRIPARKRDAIRRKLWIAALRPNEPDWNPSQWTRICELHFEGGKPGRTGVPTLKLGKDSTESEDWTGQQSYTSMPNLTYPSQSQIPNRTDHFYANSSRAKSAEYLANRVKLVRNTIYSLSVMLNQDEADLKKLSPNHPLFTEDNNVELLNGDGLICASKQLNFCGNGAPAVNGEESEPYMSGVNQRQGTPMLSPTLQPFPLFCSPALFHSNVSVAPMISSNIFTNTHASHMHSDLNLVPHEHQGRHSVN